MNKLIILIYALIAFDPVAFGKKTQDHWNISEILEKKLNLDKNALSELKVTAINDNGDLGGTFTTGSSDGKQTLFVLLFKNNYKTYIEIGRFNDVAITGLSNSGHITVNIKSETNNGYAPFLLKWNGKDFERDENKKYKFLRLNPAGMEGYVHGITENVVFGLTQFKAPEENAVAIAPYWKNVAGESITFQEHCFKGFIKNIETGEIQYKGFPLAKVYNFDSDVKAVAKNMASCGSSKAVTGSHFSKINCPFYSTKDTTLQILAGLKGYATGVNSKGQVTGVWYRGNSNEKQGFVWEYDKKDNQHDGWKNIYSGLDVYPKMINEAGIVAGIIDGNKAFIWYDNKLLFLHQIFNSKITGVKEWTDITALNNQNILVASGKSENKLNVIVCKLALI